MESMKEKAANIAASAKCGMKKAKATLQEKVEKVMAKGAEKKQTAKQKKEEKIKQAERQKWETWGHNVNARRANEATKSRRL